GYRNLKTENSRVLFKGSASDICRTNLWLRSADRVFIRMGEFKAFTFEELFEKTKALPWGDFLPEDAEFPVQGKSIKSTLFSVSDCQAIVKKAIVEKLKQKYKRDWFDETGPRYVIEVGILKDVVTLTVDTSGVGLHKRGYRQLSSQAPLKETLASALIALSYWNRDRQLVDPFCGSGTIPIEAAMVGLNIAPGLNREFDSEQWPQVPSHLWKEARDEARSVQIKGDFRILGYDIDGDVLGVARHNAKLAGVDEYIDFHRLPFEEFSTKTKYGCVICNPPYGERLGEGKEVEELYRQMGEQFKDMDTWSIYTLTAHEEFERHYGRRADRKRKLYNGRIKVDYYQYLGPRPPRQTPFT
ncbi:MAG TPA: class I SAM-dependent RNA methyltransferase, partial [Clostridia bacterium]|nr:class I SAM-dependent RNA methyltransferase [Clostridia bacterium]